MNTYAKIDDVWVIRSDVAGLEGQTVTVTKRNGASKQVVLGAAIPGTVGYFYAIAAVPARDTENVGDLSRIIQMFDRARQHLRFPAIALDGFRVNVAGQRAREPGSLTITSAERGYGGRREWLGRVTVAGVFEPGRNAPATIGAALRRFAADPAGEAAAYGRLHGACCFCNRPLRDERSTAVGYGPDCAENYGLVWGTRQPAPALPARAAWVDRLNAHAETRRDNGPQAVPDEPFAG